MIGIRFWFHVLKNGHVLVTQDDGHTRDSFMLFREDGNGFSNMKEAEKYALSELRKALKAASTKKAPVIGPMVKV